MMRNLKFILFGLILFNTASLVADEVTAQKTPKRIPLGTVSYHDQKGMDLAAIQLGGGLMIDLADHIRGSAMFAWTPTYHFDSRVSVRWNLGFVFRNVFKEDELKVGDFSLTLIEKPKFNSPLFGEVGGGLQYWTGDESRKFYPEVKAGLGYQFGDGQGFLKSFQLSYTYVIHNPLKTQHLFGVFTVGF